MAKLIRNWKELSEVPASETHYLDINPDHCNGWVVAISPVSDRFSDRKKYLSTHTFYGSSYKHSTKLLQSCGFDIEIDNWDK